MKLLASPSWYAGSVGVSIAVVLAWALSWIQGYVVARYSPGEEPVLLGVYQMEPLHRMSHAKLSATAWSCPIRLTRLVSTCPDVQDRVQPHTVLYQRSDEAMRQSNVKTRYFQKYEWERPPVRKNVRDWYTVEYQGAESTRKQDTEAMEVISRTRRASRF